MKIGEIAREADVSIDTVRFYERVGVLPPPARTASGYRDYQPETVERIQLTRQLQAIGFTLGEAVEALAAHDAGDATCESEQWRLQAVLDRVEARLAELQALRQRIAAAQQACASGHCLFTTACSDGQRRLSGCGDGWTDDECQGQAGVSASCIDASGPCCAAAGSIHMTCQPWPSRS
jgi:DNA-binding transcriptional MerR regulator